MKKSLKNKMLISIPVIFVIFIIVIITIVSIVLNKQNRSMANVLLQNTFNMICVNISERQEKLLYNSQLMATLDDMGGNLNYIKQSVQYFDYSTIRPTYIRIASVLYNIGVTANIWKAYIYNSEGILVSFVNIDKNRSTLGCIHDRNTIEIAALKQNEELTYESWIIKSRIPMEIEYKFGREILNKKEIHFKIIDGSLCLTGYVPVMGKDYNPKTGKMESRQVGMVVAIQKLDMEFVKKISELSSMEINIFTNDAMIAGTYPSFKEYSLDRFADIEGCSLSGELAIFNDVIVGKDSYFQGALPIYHNSKCIAAIVSLYSKKFAKANTFQIVKILGLVYPIGTILIMPIIIVLIVRGVINPIGKVASMMREISGNKDFTRRLNVQSQDEIGELVLSFNEMTENLQNTTTSIQNLNMEISRRKRMEEELRKTEENYRIQFEGALDAIFVADAETGTLIDCNIAAAGLIGCEKSELIGKHQRTLHTPGEIEGEFTKSFKLHAGGRHGDVVETQIVTKKGEIKDVAIKAAILEIGGRKVMQGIFRDVTEQKKSEKRMKKLMEELSRSNHELEQFVYIASHDLLEPLRKVSVFGERLKEKSRDKLDEKGLDFLNRMQNAAVRMQSLINGLLSYSRVTTKAQPFEEVDFNNILNDVVNDLEIRFQETKGKIIIDKLPVLSADPLQIRQLFQNLIGNALKYHKENEPPVIRVQSRNIDSSCEITISDNGIGFDEKYEDKIFGVFQRLVTKSEFDGAGIGLAICKKIADRHGGKITVKSKIGEGSAFIITFPVKQYQNNHINPESLM